MLAHQKTDPITEKEYEPNVQKRLERVCRDKMEVYYLATDLVTNQKDLL